MEVIYADDAANSLVPTDFSNSDSWCSSSLRPAGFLAYTDFHNSGDANAAYLNGVNEMTQAEYRIIHDAFIAVPGITTWWARSNIGASSGALRPMCDSCSYTVFG